MSSDDTFLTAPAKSVGRTINFLLSSVSSGYTRFSEFRAGLSDIATAATEEKEKKEKEESSKTDTRHRQRYCASSTKRVSFNGPRYLPSKPS